MQQIRLVNEVKFLIAENKGVAESADVGDWMQHVESFEANAVALFTDIPNAVR